LCQASINSGFRGEETVGEQGKCVILPGDGPSVLDCCNCASQTLSGVEEYLLWVEVLR